MVKANNIVVGIYGFKGSGKTTALTLLLFCEEQEKNLKNTYANYRLSFPFKWLRGTSMINLSRTLDDSAIGVDELHEYADSRNSGSLQNKRVSDFFLQSRHTRSNVYYTTQYKDQIDKRIRRITDIDIISENLFIDSDGDGDDDMFRLTIHDRRRFDIKPRQVTFYAKPVFDMFDSTQRINPFVFSEEGQKKWKKKHEIA